MKLYIVGFGPGNYDSMTMEACSVIERCGLVVGYTTYTDIIKKYFPHKEFYSTCNVQHLPGRSACQRRTIYR